MTLSEMNPIRTSSTGTSSSSSSIYKILAQVTLIQSDNARSPKNPVSAIAAERLRNEQILTQGNKVSSSHVAEKVNVDHEKQYRRRMYPREITTTPTRTRSRRRKTVSKPIRNDLDQKISMMNLSSSSSSSLSTTTSSPPYVDQRLQNYFTEGNNSIRRMMADAEYIREQCCRTNNDNSTTSRTTYISVQMGTCEVRKQDKPPEKPRRRLSLQK